MNKGIEIGVKKAKEAADHAGSKWTLDAYDVFEKYARKNATFTTEQVRLQGAKDLESPPDARAWGHIALLAKKNAIVTSYGWVKSEDPSKHGIPVTLWRSLVKRGS